MELRVLTYFLAVAKHENITKAAEELHLTQPTLSRQLSDLEEELGAKLLVRGKRRTTLTEAGLFLKSRAEEILSLTDQTVAQFSHLDEIVVGDVYIGCGETPAMSKVTQALAPLHQEYSQVHFHLTSGNEEQIRDYLQKGLLDFAILCQQTPPVDYVWRRIPYDDTWGLLLSKDNPLAAKESITPADIKNEPLLVSRQLLKQKELEHWLHYSTSELRITGTFNLLYNAAFFAIHHLASVLTFDRLLPASLDDQVIFRPLSPRWVSHNYLIWRKDHPFSRAARLVQTYFDEAFPE